MNSQNSQRMSTRGVRATVPEELKKHTREEMREARETKKREAEAVKAQKKGDKEERQLKAAKRVAAQEDKQRLDDKNNQSLRPDIDMLPSLPQPSSQSVASILLAKSQAAPVATGLSTMGTPAVVDPSPPVSPIGSPRFDLVPLATNEDDHVEEMSTDGDDLPPASQLRAATASTTESEGMIDDDRGHDGDELEKVARKESISADKGRMVGNESEESSDEYRGSNSGSEVASESDVDIKKQFEEFLKMQKATRSKKTSKKKPSKKGKTAAERKEEKLDVRRAIAAERATPLEVPLVVSQPAAPKRKEPGTGEKLAIQPQKRAKTEIGGLAKDWRSLAMSSAAPNGDQIQVTVPASGVRKDGLGGKKATIKDPKKMPEVVLEDADVQELDVKERGNSKKNWKNKDLPFDNFVRDLPLWQQKLIPSLIDWATSSIAEPFGTTNHADFKTTIQDLWTKIFAYLPPKTADGSVRADHPAIYSVGAAAVRTHRSDMGKEALKVMDRNWDREDMRAYTTEEERSAWVKHQLNGSSFLYKFAEAKDNRGAFRGRLIMETFAFHLQVILPAPYSYGNPIAGLAVAASAVKRALTVWKGGVNSIKARTGAETTTTSKVTETSFKDDPWGTVANKYYEHLVKYDNEKWKEIVLDSAIYLNAKKTKFQVPGLRSAGSTSSDGIVDGDDDIMMSP